MKRRKKGWKVLRRARESAVIRFYGVRYQVGFLVTPNDGYGPLTVFKRKKDAQTFLRGLLGWCPGESSHILVRCEYEESKEKYVWCRGSVGGRVFSSERVHLSDLPKGTALAEVVVCRE